MKITYDFDVETYYQCSKEVFNLVEDMSKDEMLEDKMYEIYLGVKDKDSVKEVPLIYVVVCEGTQLNTLREYIYRVYGGRVNKFSDGIIVDDMYDLDVRGGDLLCTFHPN